MQVRLNVFDVGLKRRLDTFIHVYFIKLSLIGGRFFVICSYLSPSSVLGFLQGRLLLCNIVQSRLHFAQLTLCFPLDPV
ncbi:hypothetical protein BDV27DRAFT_122632 [Aspergillus caelatus]|uniref:Uncharacterized protein n=1 Tax=Aspergillus caelatus TaxID=61420 RepID=A0A5N7AEN1_9EURO|nr:uncharacterized protein BDV27DRAFT_122632 [Aspergillus caelatus]KAE8368175.1 hypothetical protein BDV27DRAFT_122632 [Aspergillus caelatus]